MNKKNKNKKTIKIKKTEKKQSIKNLKNVKKTKKVKEEPKEEFKEEIISEQTEEESDQASKTTTALESNIDTSFFYTNDKFINSIDNDDILRSIVRKYSGILDASTDSIAKKSIVNFLNDENFVLQIMNFYSINIYDLFKLIYKHNSSIFKGPYLKKIRKTIEDKKYASITI